MATDSLFAELTAPGIRSVKRNWPPIVVLQIAAILLLWRYFSSAEFRDTLGEIARIKEAGGLLASALVGAVGAGLMPEAAKAVSGKLRTLNAAWLERTLVTAFVYALIAIFVDIFYRFQATLFGSGNSLPTLLSKTAFDMIIFSPCLSIPVACFLFAFYELRYDVGKMAEELRNRFYRRKIAPSLLLCWFYWTPVVMCVYAFPVPLQFPIAMLAEAAWSVLFVFINTKESLPETGTAPEKANVP